MTSTTSAAGTAPAGAAPVAQIAPPAKKRDRAWLGRAKRSFITSSYITGLWEWFLGGAARAVQPILFFTVMYNLASTYPGFQSPGPKIDLAIFIAQNASLDIGSFGLPALADQAESAGNAEGAENARKVAKALFAVMIINLVWGGIEHVFGTSIGDGWKTGVALVFVIIRAYYAAEYMRTIHALGKHDAHSTPAPAPSVVAPALDYVALAKAIEPHMDSYFEKIKASLVEPRPEPQVLDYVALAKAVAPHLNEAARAADPAPSAVAPTKEPAPPFESSDPEPTPLSGAEAVQSGSEATKSGSGTSAAPQKAAPRPVIEPGSERDQRLAAVYAELVAEGASISGRALASRAKCNRGIAGEWLRLHHGDGSESTGPATVALASALIGQSRSQSQDDFDTGELLVLDLTGQIQRREP